MRRSIGILIAILILLYLLLTGSIAGLFWFALTFVVAGIIFVARNHNKNGGSDEPQA